MTRIFISYRRDDTAGHAGWLNERLSSHFGQDEVFRDINTLEPGIDFVEAIQREVSTCDVLIAMIGRNWLDVRDPAGNRRLDNPEDFVRLEISTALARNIRVIPVLVQGALPPRSTDLPDDLKLLARRHAIELSDARWPYDVGRLIEVVEKVLQGGTPPPKQSNDPAPENKQEISAASPSIAAATNPLKWTITPANVDRISLLQAFKGHSEEINKVVFAPDGQILASASSDHTVKLWHVANGALLRTLPGHTGSVYSAAFSPDGQLLASASSDKTLKLWRVADGALLHTLQGHMSTVWSVAFMPHGQILASASSDGTIKFWNIIDGILLQTLQEPSSVYSVVFALNSQVLASASDDRTIKLWNVTDGALVHTLRAHTDQVLELASTQDGQTLASASGDQTIMLWRVADGTLLRTLEGHSDRVIGVTFAPDGQILASASSDHTVKLWRVADGTLLRTFREHGRTAYSVDFASNRPRLATAGSDKTILLWGVK